MFSFSVKTYQFYDFVNFTLNCQDELFLCNEPAIDDFVQSV